MISRSRATSRSRFGTAAGAVLLAALTVGCDAGTDRAAAPAIPTFESSTAPPSVAPPSLPDTTTPAPPPAASTPAPAPAPQQQPPARPVSSVCQTTDLTLKLGRAQAAAGTTYRALLFTNTGRRTCTIQGFPGVSYVAGDDGHQVGEAAYRVGTKGPAITLKPGMTVSAPVGLTNVRNYDPAQCRPTAVRGLRVYPPHEYDSEFVPMPGTGCGNNVPGNQLVVKTVRPGSGV